MLDGDGSEDGPVPAVVRRCSVKKGVLKSLPIYQENTCGLHLWPGNTRPATLLKNPTQVLSYEYCETFKNIYFEKHLRTAASEYLCNNYKFSWLIVRRLHFFDFMFSTPFTHTILSLIMLLFWYTHLLFPDWLFVLGVLETFIYVEQTYSSD